MVRALSACALLAFAACDRFADRSLGEGTLAGTFEADLAPAIGRRQGAASARFAPPSEGTYFSIRMDFPPTPSLITLYFADRPAVGLYRVARRDGDIAHGSAAAIVGLGTNAFGGQSGEVEISASSSSPSRLEGTFSFVGVSYANDKPDTVRASGHFALK